MPPMQRHPRVTPAELAAAAPNGASEAGPGGRPRAVLSLWRNIIGRLRFPHKRRRQWRSLPYVRATQKRCRCQAPPAWERPRVQWVDDDHIFM